MGLGRKYEVLNTKIRLVGPLTIVGFKSISLTKISYTTSETKGLHVTEKVEHSKSFPFIKGRVILWYATHICFNFYLKTCYKDSEGGMILSNNANFV